MSRFSGRSLSDGEPVNVFICLEDLLLDFSFPLLTLSRSTGGFTAEVDFAFNEQDKDVYPRTIVQHKQ